MLQFFCRNASGHSSNLSDFTPATDLLNVTSRIDEKVDKQPEQVVNVCKCIPKKELWQ